jgi:transposase
MYNPVLNTFTGVVMINKYNIESKIFLGIDVSKDTLDISVASKHYKISNTKEAIEKFVRTILANITITLCVVESTGGYEKRVMRILQANNIAVHRGHPSRIHAFAKASNHFAKTDKLDASLLEKYAAFISNTEAGDVIIPEVLEQLQCLRKVERDLEQSIHASQCRIKHMEGKAQTYIEQQITFAKEQLKEIRKDIDSIIKQDQELQAKKELLISCKGIGGKVANTLLVELHELDRINHKQIASLVGVAPKTFESGKKIAKAHIAGGRFYIRKTLYMAALVASRHCTKMKELYLRLTNAGKPAKLALTAVMRKLLVVANAILRDKKAFS